MKENEIQVEIFFINKYPVTNQEYSVFIESGGYHNSQYWTQEGWKFITENKIHKPRYWYDEKWNRLEHPVVGVSWYEADAYARWAGKQLPTEAMWKKAAYGDYSREHPWGNEEPDEARCNFNGNVGRTTPVGKYERGKSPYGVYDMTGNVWEWCEDWYDRTNKGKVVRGGSWFNSSGYLRSSFGGWGFPDYWNNSAGFRCARK